MNPVIRHRSMLFYGVALAASLVILKWLELQWLILHPFLEMYTGSIAFLFTFLGIWITLQWTKRPALKMNNAASNCPGSIISYSTNEEAIQNLLLSKREVEVLRLIAMGLSNR